MSPFSYHPKSISEIEGQNVEALKSFVINFGRQKHKALWIYGPSGTGKTSAVHALAHDLDLELIEVNASDYRNKDQIEQRVGAAAMQQSLFFKGKIILVDEVDGISGAEDRGAVPAMVKVIESTAFPIILTAQNPWDFKFNPLRSKCTLVEFAPLDHKDIAKVLEKICLKENIKFEEEALLTLARRSGGDCRAAINDLQSLTSQVRELTKNSVEELVERDRDESILHALLRIFKTTDVNLALSAFDNIKEDVDDQFLWIDENLPKEYEKKEDLARAYEALSLADRFRGRIRRWQHWRFLVYINALLTGGIAVSKDEKSRKFVQYTPTGRLLKMWWAKQKNMKKKDIASKIAEKTHSSKKQIIKNFEFYRIMFKKNKEMANSLAAYLNFDDDELAFLKK